MFQFTGIKAIGKISCKVKFFLKGPVGIVFSFSVSEKQSNPLQQFNINKIYQLGKIG